MSIFEASHVSELADYLRAHSERLVREMLRSILSEVQVPGSMVSSISVRDVTNACRLSINVFVKFIESESNELTREDLKQFSILAAEQAAKGIPLDTLLHSNRVIARLLWEALLKHVHAKDTSIDIGNLSLLSSKVLDYIDQVSSAVADSYLQFQKGQAFPRNIDRLVNLLITGSIQDDVPFKKLALSAGIVLANAYFAAVIQVLNGGLQIKQVLTEIAHIGNLLKPSDLISIIDDSTAVILLGLDLWQSDLYAVRVGALKQVFKNVDGVVCGVGCAKPHLSQLSESYVEAQQSCDMLAKVYLTLGNVATYDELLPLAILAREPEMTKRYIDKILGPVIAHDAKRKPVLLTTLRSYVDSRSVQDTARTLGVHRHTIIYRLKKIEQLLRINLQDSKDIFNLKLALLLYQIT